MKIFSIVANKIFNTNQVQHPKENGQNIFMTKPIPFDTVSFTASKASGTPLKKLAEYGLPDMYTGKDMLSYGTLSRMLKNNVFDKPLNKLIPILENYKGTLHETETEFLKILKTVEKKQPHIQINDALKQIFHEHEKKLVRVQTEILYKIIMKARQMPDNYFNDVMALMKHTDERIEETKTTAHFSEKEFIYRLQQVAKQIKVKKRHTEITAINKLIRKAKELFAPQIEEKKKFGKGISAKKLKMEYQMQPEVFKRNTEYMQYLQDMLSKSVLKHNKDIQNIFDLTNAKVRGKSVIEPFKRQEFIYDLKNIVKDLKDKKLAREIITIAHELPTSADSVSAFIVKHIDDSPEKIGYYLFKGSLASIEHIDPKVSQVKEDVLSIKKKKNKKVKKKAGNNASGKNHINNYGLSSAYINTIRSNMPFDEWIRRNPQSYKSIQKFVDRLVELYLTGKFAKVGLNRNYIPNFVERVQSMSPKEKPITIKLSSLFE